MVSRKAFEIGSERVEAGSRRTVALPIGILSDHTPVTMSAHVVHGRRDGPTVFVSSGIHGDEVIGVEIVRRLLRLPNLRTLRGTLVVVPIVNTFGFINHSRYLPDRRDLNRSFPGSAGGSLAARIAHLFMQEIVSRSDTGIDLHSAAVHRTNLPQIRVAPDDPEVLALAAAFGAPVILTAPLRPGSLRQAARDIGIDVLLFEAGEGLRFDEFAVRAGVAGILRLLRHLDMVPARGIPPLRTPSLVCASSRWLRSPAGGLLRTYKAEGDVVARDEPLARVADPFGESEETIRAPRDGVIIGRTVMPVVNEGDAILHLAAPQTPKVAEVALDDITAQLESDPLFDEDEIL